MALPSLKCTPAFTTGAHPLAKVQMVWCRTRQQTEYTCIRRWGSHAAGQPDARALAPQAAITGTTITGDEVSTLQLVHSGAQFPTSKNTKWWFRNQAAVSMAPAKKMA